VEDTNPWGAIEVRGARENNLRDVDLDIPKRKLTVFTGVSGSGKSSLVFETIAAESRRLINETYTAFVQGFMATPTRPDVESLENLTPAIVVDQEPMGANARSTVGTATDAHAMLRVIFSRLGQPHIGPANAFSFNQPSGFVRGDVYLERGNAEPEYQEHAITGGMCPECEGLGRVSSIDLDELLDRSKSLNDGAIRFPNFQPGSWYHRAYADSGFFDPDKPIRDFTDAELERFLHGPEAKVKTPLVNITYFGLVDRIRRQYLVKDVESLQPAMRAAVERIATTEPCPACDGTRLNATARSSLIAGRSIADCARMQITDLAGWLRALDAPAGARPMIDQLLAVLDHFVHIGLGYLSLERESSTLSGGEAQRTKMVRHLGSPLTDVTYVFDEPTIGLHAHDVQQMNVLLERLRDKGNTVLVVEHEPEVMRIADHVVDMGPGAGTHGGEIVYQGPFAGLAASDTATGRHLDRRQSLKAAVRQPTGAIPIRHATLHNLQDVAVDVPLGVLVAVTGVAGSGKSSLIHGCLPRTDPAVTLVDQSQIRGSRRSNPATYTGILDPIRKAFASANGVKPALFSANSEGACPACKGLGVIYSDLAFMAGVVSVCEVCEGRRFTDDVLGYHLRGRSISDVYEMSVEDASAFFKPERAVRVMLQRLVDVGLGYVTLGQMLNTLSGGERQRLKLAIEMSGDTPVYVLDEPTAGLHMQDVDNLIGLLDRLVDDGRTVIVIEHNLDVVARADWVIDLGPGAGHDGGRVIFQGTPEALARDAASLTGQHLRRRLEASTS
jgi:excinuclease UvrABC ATPase subunit